MYNCESWCNFFGAAALSRTTEIDVGLFARTVSLCLLSRGIVNKTECTGRKKSSFNIFYFFGGGRGGLLRP